MYEFLYGIDNPLGTSDPDPEPRQHYEVRCSRCKWQGTETLLKPVHKPNPSSPEDVTPTPACPACLSDQWLEYREGDYVLS